MVVTICSIITNLLNLFDFVPTFGAYRYLIIPSSSFSLRDSDCEFDYDFLFLCGALESKYRGFEGLR